MMRKAHYARTSALPAIAAVMALSSTTALAQDAPSQTDEPVAVEPAPTVSPEPVAVPEVEPVTTPEASATQTAAKPKRTVTKAKAPPPAPAPARSLARKLPPREAPAAAVPLETATKPTAVVAPIAKPVEAPAPAPTRAESTGTPNNRALEYGAGALALLAIGGGAAFAMRRRRDEDEVVDEIYEPEAAPAAEATPRHDPVFEPEPPMIAPSAFAWGNADPAPAASDDDGSDRNPGETWVERAYRGPSPANPSVSLRARLKRAAFFDKREREVAAGKAEPIEADAGLPEAMVEEQERELA